MKPLELALNVPSGRERWRELQSLDVQVSPMGRIHIARERGALAKRNAEITTNKKIKGQIT